MAVVEDVRATDGVCSGLLYLWLSEIWSSMLLILAIWPDKPRRTMIWVKKPIKYLTGVLQLWYSWHLRDACYQPGKKQCMSNKQGQTSWKLKIYTPKKGRKSNHWILHFFMVPGSSGKYTPRSKMYIILDFVWTSIWPTLIMFVFVCNVRDIKSISLDSSSKLLFVVMTLYHKIFILA